MGFLEKAWVPWFPLLPENAEYVCAGTSEAEGMEVCIATAFCSASPVLS